MVMSFLWRLGERQGFCVVCVRFSGYLWIHLVIVVWLSLLVE